MKLINWAYNIWAANNCSLLYELQSPLILRSAWSSKYKYWTVQNMIKFKTLNKLSSLMFSGQKWYFRQLIWKTKKLSHGIMRDQNLVLVELFITIIRSISKTVLKLNTVQLKISIQSFFLAYQSTLRHELMLMHVNEKSAKCNVNACERKNVMFMHVNEKSAKCNY
jgi:hypothetical protein